MTLELQHYFNPLHIYCRMIDFGFSKDFAMSVCRVYESFIFKYILHRRQIFF